jgi:hypothetical protein
MDITFGQMRRRKRDTDKVEILKPYLDDRAAVRSRPRQRTNTTAKLMQNRSDDSYTQLDDNKAADASKGGAQ